jgi:hypothetical protein
MRETNQFKIYTEIAEIKSNYHGTSLEKIAGLQRSQYQVIKMCEYYSDSKYMGAYVGNRKSIGRGFLDVPFYNIVNYRVALAKTATDLDIKDFQIISNNPEHQVQSMLLNREAYEWMNQSDFALSLNKMGLTRPKYGGYLVKKTENDDGLKIDVVRWTNVFTDQNNILGGSIVEVHHMSPVEIKKKEGAWDNVDEVLKIHKKQKTKTNSIDVYEFTGELPVEILKDAHKEEVSEEDKYTYSLQRYFCAFLDGKYVLLHADTLSGELSDYYEYLSWEDNGYGLGRGIIEDSEEAQVWTNDAVINESIAMTLAGRVGLKTTSKKLGNNILEHDHGKIYELEDGKDINSFNLAPSALGQYQNQINKWNAQADNIASSYNAVTGEQPPSGTPYSQTVLLNQVATKPFDYKRQEWGIHLTKLFDKWVIPYLVKKIYKEHILVSEFSDTELELIDESFANYSANEDIINEYLKGNVVSPIQQQDLTEQYKKHIKKTGKKRFLEVPKGYFKDVVAKTTVITTGEQKNKAVILSSLANLMETVIKSFNPSTGQFGVLQDPTLSKIFNQILELSNSGISPVSVGKGNGAAPTTTSQAPQSTPAVPTGAGAPSPVSPALATA